MTTYFSKTEQKLDQADNPAPSLIGKMMDKAHLRKLLLCPQKKNFVGSYFNLIR